MSVVSSNLGLDPLSHRLLSRFTVPGMYFFPHRSPQIPSENGWLPPNQPCRCFSGNILPEGGYWRTQNPQLVRTPDVLSLPAACIIPLSPCMIVSRVETSSLVQLGSSVLHHTYVVSSVVESSSHGQTRTKAWIVFSVSGTPWPTTSKEVSHT